MISHTPHTITIDRASLYFETQDAGYLSRFPFLWRFGVRGEARFIEQFNEMFSKRHQNALADNDDMKRILFNKAFNFLPALHEGIKVALNVKNQKKVRGVLKSLFSMYEGEFGKKFESIKDLERIEREINRLRRKLRGFNIKKEAPKKFDLEEIVVNTELIIGQQIDRRLKLYQFKKYFDRAATIVIQQTTK